MTPVIPGVTPLWQEGHPSEAWPVSFLAGLSVLPSSALPVRRVRLRRRLAGQSVSSRGQGGGQFMKHRTKENVNIWAARSPAEWSNNTPSVNQASGLLVWLLRLTSTVEGLLLCSRCSCFGVSVKRRCEWSPVPSTYKSSLGGEANRAVCHFYSWPPLTTTLPGVL